MQHVARIENGSSRGIGVDETRLGVDEIQAGVQSIFKKLGDQLIAVPPVTLSPARCSVGPACPWCS